MKIKLTLKRPHVTQKTIPPDQYGYDHPDRVKYRGKYYTVMTRYGIGETLREAIEQLRWNINHDPYGYSDFIIIKFISPVRNPEYIIGEHEGNKIRHRNYTVY